MGLDITHYKATRDKPQSTCPVLLDSSIITEDYFHTEAGIFDIGIDYFAPFLQQVEVPEVIKSLSLIDDNQHKAANIEKLQSAGIDTILSNTPNIKQYISEYEQKYCQGLEKYFDKKNGTYQWYKLHSQYGFYCKKVGYQSKGITDKFKQHFFLEEKSMFVQFKDFELAYQCIGKYLKQKKQDSIEHIRQLFQQNFLDKYEEGVSMMSVWY